jgi:hypothetical protein
MKNFAGFILLIVFVVVCWINLPFGDAVPKTPSSDSIGFFDAGVPPASTPRPLSNPVGAAGISPHPAQQAQARAMALYRSLAVADSALNRKFLALYKEAQSTNPRLLSQPDWPLQLVSWVGMVSRLSW